MEPITFEGLYHDFSSTPNPNVFYFDSIKDICNNLTFDIKPHKHTKMHQFVFIESGEIDFRFENECILIKAPAIIIIPNNIIHGFTFNKFSNGNVITLFTIILDEIIKESPMLCYFFNEPKIFRNIKKEFFPT